MTRTTTHHSKSVFPLAPLAGPITAVLLLTEQHRRVRLPPRAIRATVAG